MTSLKKSLSSLNLTIPQCYQWRYSTRSSIVPRPRGRRKSALLRMWPGYEATHGHALCIMHCKEIIGWHLTTFPRCYSIHPLWLPNHLGPSLANTFHDLKPFTVQDTNDVHLNHTPAHQLPWRDYEMKTIRLMFNILLYFRYLETDSTPALQIKQSGLTIPR